MKRFFTYMLTFAALAALGTTLSSCGDEEENAPQEQGQEGNGSSETEVKVNLPQGWFESGEQEKWSLINVEDAVKSGDYDGALRHAEDQSNCPMWTAIHVTGSSTFELVGAGMTTKRPSEYFFSKTYYVDRKSFTVYFYYAYVYAKFTCMVKNGKILVYNQSNGEDYGSLTYIENEIQFGMTYKRQSNYPKNWNPMW